MSAQAQDHPQVQVTERLAMPWHCKQVPARIIDGMTVDAPVVVCERETLSAEIERLTDALTMIAGRPPLGDGPHSKDRCKCSIHQARRALGWPHTLKDDPK